MLVLVWILFCESNSEKLEVVYFFFPLLFSTNCINE